MLLLGSLTGSSDLRAVPGASFSNPNNPLVISLVSRKYQRRENMTLVHLAYVSCDQLAVLASSEISTRLSEIRCMGLLSGSEQHFLNELSTRTPVQMPRAMQPIKHHALYACHRSPNISRSSQNAPIPLGLRSFCRVLLPAPQPMPRIASSSFILFSSTTTGVDS
jgi:hypothetical protein